MNVLSDAEITVHKFAVITLRQQAFHPGGHFWYYHTDDALSSSEVTVTHLKIRHP